MSDYSLSQKCFAEAFGTAILIGGGCGSVCAIRYAKYPSGPLVVPVIFGLSVSLAIYTTRHISGAHINPAMTAAFAINRPSSFSKELVLPYWISQMGGATIAAAMNYLIFKNGIKVFETSEKIIRGTKASAASFDGAFGMIPNMNILPKNFSVLVAEFGMTAALSFIIFALTNEEANVPSAAIPALIGATVTTLVVPFAAVTGCGMNPARDLGPRLVTVCCGWGSAALSRAWWAYSVGPLFGAVFGGALHEKVFTKNKKFSNH
jgi:glycerol uptake facilitator protein